MAEEKHGKEEFETSEVANSRDKEAAADIALSCEDSQACIDHAGHRVSSELDAECRSARLSELAVAKAEVEAELKALQCRLCEIVVEEQQLESVGMVHGRREEYAGAGLGGDDEKGLSEDEVKALRKEKLESLRAAIEKLLQERVTAVAEGRVPDHRRHLKFLDKSDPRRGIAHRIALASYPRSGNSLLRSLIERLTGVFTGSDADPQRPLNVQLVEAGMMGEGMVSDHVFVVKTHFPERLGRCAVQAARAIVIVRNPFDAIASYFNMVLTETHTDTIDKGEYLKYGTMWDLFVREEVQIWKQFHAHWKSKLVKSKVDTLFVRYEDLVEHRQATLEKVAKFVYKLETLAGSEHEALVKEIAQEDTAKLGIYQPRTQDDKPSEMPSQPVGTGDQQFLPLSPLALRNLDLYSSDLQSFVIHSAKSELAEFGYWSSWFEAPYGETKPLADVDRCIIVKVAAKSGNSPAHALLNRRYGIRPITKDDPYGRGFGQRWKRYVDSLPPVRCTRKTTTSRSGNARKEPSEEP